LIERQELDRAIRGNLDAAGVAALGKAAELDPKAAKSFHGDAATTGGASCLRRAARS
jgi:hypothetical protein